MEGCPIIEVATFIPRTVGKMVLRLLDTQPPKQWIPFEDVQAASITYYHTPEEKL